MSELERFVQKRLAAADLKPEWEQRIVRELVEHLEEIYKDARDRGLDSDAALDHVARQVPDWDQLISDIRRADPSAVRSSAAKLSEASLQLARRRGGLWPALSDLLDDLAYGARVMARRPGFTWVAALTLALGIAASTAIFSIVNGVFLRPLPYPEPHRLAMLWETNLERGFTRQLVSLGNVPDYRQSASLGELAAIWIRTSLLTGGDAAAEAITNARVEYHFFSTVGVSPALGRAFRAEEDAPGKNTFVILSHGIWMRRFGGDTRILGQTLQLDGTALEIVGVMPPGFDFPAGAALWTPMGRDAGEWYRGGHSHQVIARLGSNVSWNQARTELDAIAAGLEQEHPATNRGWGVLLVPLREQQVGSIRRPLAILTAAAGLLLLIACANVAGLLLAWSSGRRRELALRSALGASRIRLARQLLAENALLALVAGVLGLTLAWGGVRVLLSADGSSPPRMEELLADATSEAGQLPHIDQVGIDPLVVAFALSLSLGTILLFGLYPALRYSRLSPPASLKDGSRASPGMPGARLRSALIVGQVALALVLLLGGGLLLRSFEQLRRADPGFQAQGLLSLRINVSGDRYPDRPSRAAFHDRILAAVRDLPSVEGSASYWFLPFHKGTFPNFYRVTKTAEAGSDAGMSVLAQISSEDFHELMRIPLVTGRYFSTRDNLDSPYVVIVNQVMAKQFWPAESPLDQKIFLGDDPIRVIGVVADTRRFGLTASSPPMMYIPFAQNPHTSPGLLVRASGSPLNLAAPIRQTVQRIDPQAAVSDVVLLEDVIGKSLAHERLTMLLAGSFAIAALLLAVCGLYGLISYLAGRRRHEFGIRLALGARTSQVVSLVLGNGLRLVLLGVVLGFVVSLALTRLLSSVLFNVSPTDPLTYLAVPCALVAAALLACYLPARRAASTDPLQALRYE